MVIKSTQILIFLLICFKVHGKIIQSKSIKDLPTIKLSAINTHMVENYIVHKKKISEQKLKGALIKLNLVCKKNKSIVKSRYVCKAISADKM